ncbi:MAG: NAD(P)-dependent oxidoreductase [Clostridia bacterium]|nr:NAD(P)-dependent oxidoreductase [Clostridia bacterium]
MKTVFLTGGSGNMGWAAFKELVKRPDVKINFLSRPSDKNKHLLLPYMGKKNVEIIWGDFLDYETILKGVTGADYVLHIGGMVSPAADYKPYSTRKVNVGAAENICKAVLAQPNADDIKVCYIGSVAETGDRNMPIHWGRCGDPIKVSVYDHYAVSKVMAEKVFVESGIKHWVVMRQSGILYPEILHNMEPIMYHVPLNGMLEWCTVEDAGRLMANLVTGYLPDDFWCRFYNIGSGKEYRLTNFEFEEYLLGCIGLGSPKTLFDPNWFTTKNFHGQYYADGDILENYLHFRANIPVKEYFDYLAKQCEKFYTIPKYIPTKKLIGACAKPFMKKIAMTKKWGTLDWIKTQDPVRLSAYYGSYEEYLEIPSKWEDFKLESPDKDITAADKYKLDHGYDESKPKSELGIEDMKQAAAFRGGECLSEKMTKGDLSTKLRWKCGCCGAEFEASPNLILLGGHWCPECYLPVKKWNYDEIAKTNPFFAQVWYTNHRKDEHNVYVFDEIFEGWEKKK